MLIKSLYMKIPRVVQMTQLKPNKICHNYCAFFYAQISSGLPPIIYSIPVELIQLKIANRLSIL